MTTGHYDPAIVYNAACNAIAWYKEQDQKRKEEVRSILIGRKHGLFNRKTIKTDEDIDYYLKMSYRYMFSNESIPIFRQFEQTRFTRLKHFAESKHMKTIVLDQFDIICLEDFW